MKGFKDISITRKLYFTIGLMAFLIIAELTTLWFAVNTLSSVRAFVAGEGLWSKSEKDAIISLRSYAYTHDENDYKLFWEFLRVPLGDHKARVELLKPHPNFEIAKQGLLEGRNHEDDIQGMINLVRRFHSISYIEKAIEYWKGGDDALAEFIPLAKKMHNEINSPDFSQAAIDSMILEMDVLNAQVTEMEDNFSFTLGAGSRWLEDVILKLLLFVAITVEVTGLLLTFSISKSIRKGLNEINKAVNKINQGDLSGRAKVLSKDEIGKLALTINQMTDKLIRSNNELLQFVYISSHDLQEPLRTIINFTQLLEEDHGHEFSDESYPLLMFIQGAAVRMQNQIHDLLEYSRIGNDIKKIETDCNVCLEEVLDDFQDLINEHKITFEKSLLPTIFFTSDFHLLLKNLIGNAIKFREANVPLKISIDANEEENSWTFILKDNGIGIEKIYHEKIFTIFQKLHSRAEYDGSGIGLAQCKKIVEVNNGNIWVESIPNEGSAFYFSIPKTNFN